MLDPFIPPPLPVQCVPSAEVECDQKLDPQLMLAYNNFEWWRGKLKNEFQHKCFTFKLASLYVSLSYFGYFTEAITFRLSSNKTVLDGI